MSFTDSTTTEGLKATTINIPATGPASINVTMTTPTTQSPAASQGPGGGAGTGIGGAPNVPSQIVLTVRQNGSIVATSTAGDRGITIPALNCTAADVITVTPTSSLASDQQSNAVRITVAVSQG